MKGEKYKLKVKTNIKIWIRITKRARKKREKGEVQRVMLINKGGLGILTKKSNKRKDQLKWKLNEIEKDRQDINMEISGRQGRK